MSKAKTASLVAVLSFVIAAINLLGPALAVWLWGMDLYTPGVVAQERMTTSFLTGLLFLLPGLFAMFAWVDSND